MLERITFLLAVIGYAGLTTTALLAALRRLPVVFWRGVALVIVSHVVLVWMVRYDWQLASATRNRERQRRWALHTASSVAQRRQVRHVGPERSKDPRRASNSSIRSF